MNPGDEPTISEGTPSAEAESTSTETVPGPIAPRSPGDRPEREPRSYDDGDTAGMRAAPDAGAAVDRSTINWSEETNAQRIGLELRRIEADIRAMLEQRDPKRKRKMAGTRRWHELEEDILSWRFTGRFEEETLRRLSELIARRHFLFARLRFLAFTRPAWNS